MLDVDKFHTLPQLDHPNLIQRKAISGGCRGPRLGVGHPQPLKSHGPRQSKGENQGVLPPGLPPVESPRWTMPNGKLPILREGKEPGHFPGSPKSRWVIQRT